MPAHDNEMHYHNPEKQTHERHNSIIDHLIHTVLAVRGETKAIIPLFSLSSIELISYERISRGNYHYLQKVSVYLSLHTLENFLGNLEKPECLFKSTQKRIISNHFFCRRTLSSIYLWVCFLNKTMRGSESQKRTGGPQTENGSD